MRGTHALKPSDSNVNVSRGDRVMDQTVHPTGDG